MPSRGRTLTVLPTWGQRGPRAGHRQPQGRVSEQIKKATVPLRLAVPAPADGSTGPVGGGVGLIHGGIRPMPLPIRVSAGLRFIRALAMVAVRTGPFVNPCLLFGGPILVDPIVHRLLDLLDMPGCLKCRESGAPGTAPFSTKRTCTLSGAKIWSGSRYRCLSPASTPGDLPAGGGSTASAAPASEGRYP